jgi:uncharacterized protein YfaS (alpha-2-macroglobulin family)
MSQFMRWVSGGQQPPARQVEQEVVTLIPDKESYQPGDVAQILVQSPFGPAEGLLTLSRSGLLTSERFTMAEGSHTLQVPIRDDYIPNLHIQVDLAGSAPRTNDQGEIMEELPPRPAFASGSLNLSIPPLSRTLSIDVAPQENELEPGGETTVDVTVLDAAGRPVSGAEVALVVVDEAILALSDYQLVDPLSIFYQERSPEFTSRYGRSSIVLANPELLGELARSQNVAADLSGDVAMAETVVEEMEMAAPAEAPAAMAADAGFSAGPDAPAIRVRINFDPLAEFAPEVRTDDNGRALVPITLPDNLTRYRVMAVAVDDDKSFGSAETNLTARLPLMVRPSAPRFLNFGDNFELPVVLQNQTGEPMSVDVVVEAGNLELLPARDRVEVRFPATTIMPGTARLQIAAVSDEYADAATAELPVYTPATTEAFATYGVIDEGSVAQPVAAPSAVFPQFGGLEIGGLAGADRRRALSCFLSLRLFGPTLVAYPGRRRTARRTDGILGRGAAFAGGDGSFCTGRHRTVARLAELRRRLPLLEARPGLDPLHHGPRSPRLAASQAQRLRRATGDAADGAGIPAPDRAALSRPLRQADPPDD